jgi:hypothetical protein
MVSPGATKLFGSRYTNCASHRVLIKGRLSALHTKPVIAHRAEKDWAYDG